MSKYIRYNTLPIYKCDIIYDIPDKETKPLYTIKNNIVIHDNIRIFVKTDLLDWFIENILNKINNKFVLFTGISDYTPTNIQYSKVLQNTYLIKWICTNNTKIDDKIISYPIGFQEIDRVNHIEKNIDNYLIDKQINKNEKKILLPYHRNTSVSRERFLNKLYDYDIIEKIVEKQDINDYFKSLTSFNFCICIRGNGIDVHRIYECILTRTYPLFITDIFFPILDELSIIQFNESTFLDFIKQHNILQILNYLYKNIDWDKLQNILKTTYWETKFDKVIKNY